MVDGALSFTASSLTQGHSRTNWQDVAPLSCQPTEWWEHPGGVGHALQLMLEYAHPFQGFVEGRLGQARRGPVVLDLPPPIAENHRSVLQGCFQHELQCVPALLNNQNPSSPQLRSLIDHKGEGLTPSHSTKGKDHKTAGVCPTFEVCFSNLQKDFLSLNSGEGRSLGVLGKQTSNPTFPTPATWEAS